MGTNYYRKRIPTQSDREELHALLDKYIEGIVNDWEFRERVEQVLREVHICKISFGWQVCFDHNWGEYYQPNRKDLERFLSEPGTVIEDEYGKRYTADEFWDIVKKHNENPRNSLIADSYRDYEISRGRYDRHFIEEYIHRCEVMFGLDCCGETDFCVDGLRFAVYTDFS